MRRGAAFAVSAVTAVCALTGLTACGANGQDGGGSPGGPSSSSGSGSPRLSVRGAYVPQPVTSGMAGGFLTVRNDGGAPDKLTSVTSSLSDDVQLHRTSHQQMKQVTSLPVPAHGELKLGRGGAHLMLMKLKRKPAKGDKVAMTLHFARSAAVKVSVPVEATNYVPGSPGK